MSYVIGQNPEAALLEKKCMRACTCPNIQDIAVAQIKRFLFQGEELARRPKVSSDEMLFYEAVISLV